MRSQFTFYKSFDDVYQDLNDKQRLEFVTNLLDVQFLRVRIEDVVFKDSILKHIWNAQKHSILKSINGYLDSQKNERVKNPFIGCYDDSFKPLQIPYEGGREQVKDKEEDKEEDKVKVKEENKFSFNLKSAISFDKLTEEYKSKLKEYIEKHNEELFLKRLKDDSKLREYYTYQDMENDFLASGKTQKNFQATFNKYKYYTYEREIKRRGLNNG